MGEKTHSTNHPDGGGGFQLERRWWRGPGGRPPQHLSQMKLINAIAAAAVIGASLVSPNDALAGLGAAEGGTKRTFDAYCGKKEMIARLNLLVKDLL